MKRLTENQKKMYTVRFAQWIIDNAVAKKQRSGQFLMNMLPDEASFRISGTLWDPFNKNYTVDELVKWLDDHIIFADDGHIIGVFSRNDLVWTEEYDDG